MKKQENPDLRDRGISQGKISGCNNRTYAEKLQANCGCCAYVDYCHAGNLQIQLCHWLGLAFPVYGEPNCNFKPWKGWEDCFRNCGIKFDGRRS